MKTRQKEVPARKFIQIYLKSSSHTEVARAAGMSLSAVSTRARFFRMKGIKIKLSTADNPRRLDVPSLNRMIARLQNEQK